MSAAFGRPPRTRHRTSSSGQRTNPNGGGLMKRSLGVAIGGIFLLGAGGAFATPPGPGQHFDCSDGGTSSCAADDGGCVSNTKNHLKCSDGESKAFSKAIASVIKCHIKQADAAFKTLNGKPTTFDEEGCENAAVAKLNAARAKIEGAGLCAPAQINNFTVEEAVVFQGAGGPS